MRFALPIVILCFAASHSALAAESLHPSVRMPASEQSKCPPAVPNPKKLSCVTKMTYVGQKLSKEFVIPLKGEIGGPQTGSLEFQFPGISNPNNEANSMKATVFTDTHGNSPTCQQQQTFEIELNVLGYKLVGAGRKTTLKIDDGFGTDTFDLDMTCTAQ